MLIFNINNFNSYTNLKRIHHASVTVSVCKYITYIYGNKPQLSKCIPMWWACMSSERSTYIVCVQGHSWHLVKPYNSFSGCCQLKSWIRIRGFGFQQELHLRPVCYIGSRSSGMAVKCIIKGCIRPISLEKYLQNSQRIYKWSSHNVSSC